MHMDNMLMTPVPRELLQIIEEQGAGPDLFKVKLLEQQEQELRKIAVTSTYLKVIIIIECINTHIYICVL